MLKTNIRKTLAVMVTATACAVYADAAKIRLQFVFDAGAMDYISQAGVNYDDFAMNCVARMNTVLTNSRLNGYFTYELACTTLLPGVDNTNPATGYTEGWAALTGNRGDEWAGMLQDRYNNAADVVVLLINTGTYAGATGNSHPYTGSGAEYAINYAGNAFSVCSIMTAAREIEGIASGHQVLSHEVAHTLGCGHPDTQDRQPGPQSTAYAAGLQFKLPTGKETALPPSASVTQNITAYYGTTLALMSGSDLGTGLLTVVDGGTLKVAESGAVTLGGDLEFEGGATLAFNFTERAVTPQIAVAEGKTLTAKGTVKVKIAEGSLRATGGEKILTTCGGFTAEKVSLVAGAPDWVRGLSVNSDGNIVLDVKPMGTTITFR